MNFLRLCIPTSRKFQAEPLAQQRSLQLQLFHRPSLIATHLRNSTVHTYTSHLLEMDSPPQISEWPSTTGKGWTGTTPTSFELFPKLPAELRIRVWSFNVNEPRVIELEPNSDYSQIITRTKTPGNLQACRESRFEALKIYELLSLEPGYVYSRTRGWSLDPRTPDIADVFVHFEIDTVLFKSEMFTTCEAVDLAARGMPIKHEKVRDLAVQFTGCHVENSFEKDIQRCCALRTLSKIFDDCRKGMMKDLEEVSNRSSDGGAAAQHLEIAGQQCLSWNLVDRNTAEERQSRAIVINAYKGHFHPGPLPQKDGHFVEELSYAQLTEKIWKLQAVCLKEDSL